MATERLLMLAQWLSPAFPTGAFAWSHGLESAIRDGIVATPEGLQAWLVDLLEHGAGRSDAILIHAAHAAPDAAALQDLADLALALQPAAERRAETLGQGAAFAGTVRAVWGHDLPDMALPVVLGRAARLEGLEPGAVAALHLLGLVTTLTQAAQRLMPLGQTRAQRLLHHLRPLCAATAEAAAGLGPEDLGGAGFAIDIAALRHEVQEPRLFRS